ncbi:MAG: hypothetical protein WDN28_22175 [Chthoniobacter sp.]
MPFLPALSPHGRLYLQPLAPAEGPEAATFSEETAQLLEKAFARSSADGLLALATRREDAAPWRVEFAFWGEFADACLTMLAHAPEAVEEADTPPPALPAEMGFDFTLRLPAMPGAEYASREVFAGLWSELAALARREARAAGGLRAWLGGINPALHLLGKVTFHLAENKRSPETPFAFMATYTHRLSAQEKPVHLPLGRALQEYVGAKKPGGVALPARASAAGRGEQRMDA